MKMKKVIGMLITILMLALVVCTIVPTKTYAAAASYELGIRNVRESGEAYGIGDLKSDKTPEKKVWKIVSYSNNNINYDNAFYCIKAEHGFVDNNSTTSVETIRRTYNVKLDMKTQSSDVINKLNAINTAIGDTQLSQETYNKIMWIIDQMYLPKASSATQDKTALLNAARITNPILTDDDIEVVQQLALWYFTNPNDSKYNNLTLPTIYSNNKTGNDSNYKSLADWGNDPLLNDDSGQKRQNQADKLYKYFIDNADANYQAKGGSPVIFNSTNPIAEQIGERYLVGPFNITVDSTRLYTINELQFKDQSGNTINLTGDNQLLNANKEVVSSGNISDVYGQNFYISLPINTSITNMTFTLNGTYPTTQATFYTTEESTFRGEQPVVLVEKTNGDITGTANIVIPSPRNLDLALRKSITKLNNVQTTGRIPEVDATNLENGTETTAIYNHTKQDLIAENDQLIEYTMTVYNEGQKDGYALEIKDYLPAGIEFVELVSDSDKYTAQATKNSDGTTTVTITNTGRNVLGKYTTGTPNSESVTIRCKVIAEAGSTAKRLVNIAEITKYFDSESNIEKTADRDSQISNFPNNLKNNPEYRGNGTEGNYTKGQQDDDDFEAIVIPGKYFDLALRKFVSGINGKALGTSRAPVPDVTNLANGTDTTATYNQSKLPVSVKKGDIVTYTIRVYNEGQLDGYASEITDHLPEQLEFLPEDEENIANGWAYDENDTELRTIRTTHLSKNIDEANVIKAFNGTTLDYKDITVKCKVKTTVTSGEKITNIADITEFTDKSGNEVTDRDSRKK